MKENIYTIPLNDLFSEKCGCPLCRLDETLRKRYAEFIMGPAMMAPEIRVQTNRLGFCKEHYNLLEGFNNKLSLALLTETRLKELEETISGSKLSKNRYKELTKSCYLCEKENASRDSVYDNIIHTFRKEKEFRELFSEQETLCLPHFQALINKASSLSKRDYLAFSEAAASLCRKGYDNAADKVKNFSKSFDYRTAEDEEFNPLDYRDALYEAGKFLNKE